LNLTCAVARVEVYYYFHILKLPGGLGAFHAPLQDERLNALGEEIVGRCGCGVNLGFLKSGVCDGCREELTACEKGLALLRRLDPREWKHSPSTVDEEGYTSPEYFSFSVITPDGEHAHGLIETTDRMWRLMIRVNDIPLFERGGRVWDSFYVDQLHPYVLSIPGDPDEMRKAEEARKAYELRIREEQELKRKYGV
jgi:hypothetical protein